MRECRGKERVFGLLHTGHPTLNSSPKVRWRTDAGMAIGELARLRARSATRSARSWPHVVMATRTLRRGRRTSEIGAKS